MKDGGVEETCLETFSDFQAYLGFVFNSEAEAAAKERCSPQQMLLKILVFFYFIFKNGGFCF